MSLTLYTNIAGQEFRVSDVYGLSFLDVYHFDMLAFLEFEDQVKKFKDHKDKVAEELEKNRPKLDT